MCVSICSEHIIEMAVIVSYDRSWHLCVISRKWTAQNTGSNRVQRRAYLFSLKLTPALGQCLFCGPVEFCVLLFHAFQGFAPIASFFTVGTH